ncbi:hypothetical protein SELMODRAFT_429673 [Selaginella moellendorffii]|uniref:Uncharacterized protein n=1 Tax=Selaginella moellendorffii TaxID=88036 RepID=D8T6X8_SELML|nr:hypothetical protein SELMODRAFT_429673 [Selaginella moellendorffii]
MLQGRESLIRVVGKRQDAPPAQQIRGNELLVNCHLGLDFALTKNVQHTLVSDVFQTHFRDCTIGLVHGFLSIQSEARLLNLLFKPYAMVELGNSSWKYSGRVNWENEDLHTITGLSVIHMLLAEDQGGQNWSKPRVRDIACPSNRWPGFLFSRMPGSWTWHAMHELLGLQTWHSHNWWHLELCHLEGGPAENVLRIFDTRIWGDRERAERDTFAVSLNALEFLLCLQVNRFGDHIMKLLVDKIASALYEYGSGNESAVSSLLGSKFSARELKVIGASNEQMRVFGHLWATASSNLMVTLVYVYCWYLLRG